MSSEFPAVDLTAWRKQVETELRGKDFEESLLLPNEDGFVLQPVYDASNSASAAKGAPGSFPFTRGSSASPRHLLVQEYGDSDTELLRRGIEGDLAGGVDGIRLRLDRRFRLGVDPLQEKGISTDGALAFDLGSLGALLAPLFERDAEGLTRGRLLSLQAGAEALPAAAIALALRKLENIDATELPCHFGLDPFAALTRDGRLPRPLERHLAEGIELAQALDPMGDDRAIEIDGTVWQECGADCPFEMGLMTSALAAWLRAAVAAKVDPALVARRIVLRVPMERDVFVGIAKLRALRRLWALVLAHHEIRDVPPLIWAVSSRRSLSRLDPFVNILRTTTQGFSAACGGADLVTVLPFDLDASPRAMSEDEWGDDLAPEATGFAESQEYAQDSTTRQGRRLARNEMLMLDEESGLFRVQDPAGGSHYVETLTDSLAAAAFDEFKSIEQSGGLGSILVKGQLSEDLMARLGDRKWYAMHRKLAMTGTNEYPVADDRFRPEIERQDGRDLKIARERLKQHARSRGGLEPVELREGLVQGLVAAAAAGAMSFELGEALGGTTTGPGIEPPLAMRDSHDFESLRDMARAAAGVHGPLRVFLANLGELAEHLPRAGFARNVFAIPGLEIIDGGGTATGDAEAAAEEIARQMAVLDSVVAVCLCGSDARYDEQAGAVLARLRSELPEDSRIVLAGNPGPERRAELEAAGIHDFIHVGSNVWVTLSKLLTPLVQFDDDLDFEIDEGGEA